MIDIKNWQSPYFGNRRASYLMDYILSNADPGIFFLDGRISPEVRIRAAAVYCAPAGVLSDHSMVKGTIANCLL